MQAKLCILLLAIGLSEILAVPYPLWQPTNPSADFLQFLIQSRDLISDSDHSIECLNYYSPLLNDELTAYQNNFKGCLEESALEVSQINDKTKDDRDAIDASAVSSCEALTVCSEKEAAEEYFQCYSEAGSNGTKSMFTISANASELLAFVQEEVRLIKVNEYVCTNKTQRAYAENSAKLYEDLGSCISGAPIPESTTSTETPVTESSTDTSSVVTDSSTDSSSVVTDSSTDSSSVVTDSSTDSSSVVTDSSTDSSSDATDSSTDSSSAATESSTDSSSDVTDSSTDSSSAATESSTDSSSDVTESSTDSSSAATESSTDSSSDATESSTDSSSAATDSTSESSSVDPESPSEKEAAPEEDLRSVSSQNNREMQRILKSLQLLFKSQ
ncbi:cell wall protein IFF6 [Drosophila ficusphila]|uniref:cell wall protein IFF6 n=1 Tax=Drosophila ficusphila TaxID=30025 RepID=UPI0007E86A59|nr:cell wall protein IFF6 [Drosophila ficusphila]